MWEMIKGFSEHVSQYSTCFGQLWYLCVFLFRVIVVVTIGEEVYSDEQSDFQCSTGQVGCDNLCFNKFSKISHIRFWAFQILAVATPTILFHFYAMNVTGKIENLKLIEDELRKAEEGLVNNLREKDIRHHPKKKNHLGKVKTKKVYDGNQLKEISLTDNINLAYYINVVIRLIVEGAFIYFSYNLFRFMDSTSRFESLNPMDFLWFRVPVAYICEGDDVKAACYQHVAMGNDKFVGYVPCWISRPAEKTIFLRYMNVMSAICFVLSAIEFVYLTFKGGKYATRWCKKRRLNATNAYRPRSLLSSLQSSPPPLYESYTMSTLAVPIRLSSLQLSIDSSDMSLLDETISIDSKEYV